MSDAMEELLQKLQAVDGVYCPSCDKVIKFEEAVTENEDRRLDCPSCVGECGNCQCILAAIYCFVSRVSLEDLAGAVSRGAGPPAYIGGTGTAPSRSE